MRIVVAMDSFKGSLSASEACGAVASGLLRAHPEAAIDVAPMSDGGEGFAETLIGAGVEGGGVRVCDAACVIGLGGGEGGTGLDVWAASSAPVAAMLRSLLTPGTREVIVGLGGTRTMDAGLGFAAAIGLRVYGDGDAVIDVARVPICDALVGVRRVAWCPEDWVGRALARGVRVRVASDVTSPLAGADGAPRTFGAQKGASRSQVEALDGAFVRFGACLERDLGVDPALRGMPGAGAAGGLGYALAALLGGALEPGAAVAAEAVGLGRRVEGADLVVTGEGRLDAQSARGKVVSHVAGVACAHGVPCVAVVGALGEGYRGMLKCDGNAAGLDGVVEASRGVAIGEAVADARRLVARAAASVAALGGGSAWSG